MSTPSPSRSGRESTRSAGSTISQSLLRALDALSARLGRTSTMPAHLKTGLRGEEEAFFYLCRRGYTIVARRWRTPKLPGDVDLIGWEGETLCFIEVKTRVGRDLVPAEFAVDQKKQKMLRSMASVFRKRLPEATRHQTLIRFDVVSVYLPTPESTSPIEIELFPAAFERHPGRADA